MVPVVSYPREGGGYSSPALKVFGFLPFPFAFDFSSAHFAKGCHDFNFLPTHGFPVLNRRLKKRLAGEQKATEF